MIFYQVTFLFKIVKILFNFIVLTSVKEFSFSAEEYVADE
jgi:hypothetical protein